MNLTLQDSHQLASLPCWATWQVFILRWQHMSSQPSPLCRVASSTREPRSRLVACVSTFMLLDLTQCGSLKHHLYQSIFTFYTLAPHRNMPQRDGYKKKHLQLCFSNTAQCTHFISLSSHKHRIQKLISKVQASYHDYQFKFCFMFLLHGPLGSFN